MTGSHFKDTRPSIEALVLHAQQLLLKSNKERVVITITGTPGSGKSTLAQNVAQALNIQESGIAAVVGMDGFHLTRAQLDQLEDPIAAHKFRGAPFTFNAQGVVNMVLELQDNSRTIEVPTFDHAKKDPVDGGLKIPSSVRIVLVEGLYLHLQDEPWNQIVTFSDDTWRVETKPEVARERLAARHVISGIVKTEQEGYERADFNDIPNGQYLLEHSFKPKVVIHT